MFKVKNDSMVFQKKTDLISHDHFTKNSRYNFKEPTILFKIFSDFSVI